MEDIDVAGLLRRIRRRADLSQRQLAAAIGMSKSAVASVEAGTGRLDLRSLSRAAALAGLRLALVDADGVEVAGMAEDTVRDLAGRRFPAHLDTRYSDEGWWHDAHHYGRPRAWYTFDRDRTRRDADRVRRGTPDDHLVPQPEDSPAARRQARRDAAWRARRAEQQRRLAAGQLPPDPGWVCDCPPQCPEDEYGTRPAHVDECECRCDLG